MKTAILACCVGPYTEAKKEGEEIWTVNTAFRKPTYQANIDRLYIMDSLANVSHLDRNGTRFIDQVAALDCEVVCQAHHPEIPRSRPFKRQEIAAALGAEYYASTISYMFAEAIYERYDKIVLHRINSIVGSKEYLEQKACHDFWCGYAKGRGIEVVASPDSFLMKNYPWCAPQYGYGRYKNEIQAGVMLRERLQEIMKLPVEAEGVQ